MKRLLAEFTVADLNGDGKVSFDEFLRYYELLKEHGTEMDEVAAMFHFFDADGSGELDRVRPPPSRRRRATASEPPPPALSHPRQLLCRLLVFSSCLAPERPLVLPPNPLPCRSCVACVRTG